LAPGVFKREIEKRLQHEFNEFEPPGYALHTFFGFRMLQNWYATRLEFD